MCILYVLAVGVFWLYSNTTILFNHIRHKIFHNGIITLLQFIAGFVHDMN